MYMYCRLKIGNDIIAWDIVLSAIYFHLVPFLLFVSFFTLWLCDYLFINTPSVQKNTEFFVTSSLRAKKKKKSLKLDVQVIKAIRTNCVS